MKPSSHEPDGATSNARPGATARPRVPRVLSNMGAHLGGIYGAKIFDFVLLAVVTRKLSMAEVGTYFLAQAAGGMVFRIVDLGLYPVLQRRAARGRAGVDLLRWATGVRALGLVVLSAGFAVVAAWRYPGEWLVATAFFFASGAYQVHEVPRAILAGRELFSVTARLGVATKALEVSLCAPLVWFGFGVWPWAIGRVASQLGLLAVLYRSLLRELPRTEPSSPRAIIREGLPFWFTSLFQSVVFRVDTLAVGAYLGLAEAAHLGIASRLAGGAIGIVNSLLIVTFPALARERRRFIVPREAWAVIGLSSALGIILFVTAPVAVRVVTGRWEQGPIDVTRALVPVIALSAMSEALTWWLRAKNRENAVAVLAVVTGVASTAILLVLVRAEGTLGAALGRDTRAVLELIGAGFYTLAVLGAVHAPLAWGVDFVPLGRRFLLTLTARRRERLTREVALLPGVVSVSIGGSGRPGQEHRYRPGVSDLDFTIACRAPLAELPTAILRMHSLMRKGRWLGNAQAMVVDGEILAGARRLGHPILSAPHVPLWGERIEPEIDPLASRHWALSHAIERFMQLQRVAAEESRHDGGARATAVAKELRHVVSHLQIAAGSGDWMEALRARVPVDVFPGQDPQRLWLRPEEVGEILMEAQVALASACDEEVRTWPIEEAGLLAPPQALLDLAARYSRRVKELECLGAPIELTPTSPVSDQALLVVAAPELGRDAWLRFLSATSAAPRANEESAPRPVVLPPAVLRAAAFMERTPLVYLGRRQAALALSGPLTALARPDATFLRDAAGREILHACIRIPTDLAWLRRAESGRNGKEARLFASFARNRVDAYLDGRLVLLRLLADGISLPAQPAEIASIYAARYGDSALSARLAARDGNEPDAPSVEAALLEWMHDVTPEASRSIRAAGLVG